MTTPDHLGGSNEGSASITARMSAVMARRAPTLRPKVTSAKYLYTDTNGVRVYKLTVHDPSSGRTRHMTQGWTGTNLIQPGKPSSPQSRPDAARGPAPDHLGARADEAALDRAADQWLTTIANLNASANTKSSLVKAVENWTGSAGGLNQRMAQLVKAASPVVAEAVTEESFIDPFAGLDFGGGFGGGGGGGFGGPVYRAPDKRVVEDFVKGAVVSLIGSIPDDEMVDGMVDLYMTDHRRNFDSETEEIDPSQSVKEAIRNTEQYQAIHQLRPESEDERAWVAQRRQAAAQGGLNTELQEDFAITQATVGGDVADVQEAAGVAQLQRSQSTRGTLLEGKLRGVTQAMFSRVR